MTKPRSRLWHAAAAAAAAVLGCSGLAVAGTLGAAAAAGAPAAPAAASGCQVTYSVSSDWGSGFSVSITITNNGPATSSWTLGYAYSGNQALSQGWNGTWSQSGQNITVTSASWNGSLATGASASIGANFTYSGTNTAPTAFTLNGAPCNGATCT